MQEGIQALAEVVSNDITTALKASPFFALCIDEAMDVSVTKQQIVYCRYITGGDVMTQFLHIATLPNGLAVTIADRIHQLCTDLDLDLQRFCGLGR